MYLILLLSFFVFNFNFVLAKDFGLNEAADAADIGGSAGLPEVVGTIVGVVLSFLGMVFFILLVYGGFMWMTARGNETQVDKAKKIIGNSIWGLIIVLMAYVISSLIVGSFIGAVT